MRESYAASRALAFEAPAACDETKGYCVAVDAMVGNDVATRRARSAAAHRSSYLEIEPHDEHGTARDRFVRQSHVNALVAERDSVAGPLGGPPKNGGEMDDGANRMSAGSFPRVGVGVLLVDASGRVLLSLRRRPPEAGAWSILGGSLEPFERIEECARREAREEAGVEIMLDRLLCVTDHILMQENQHWVAPAFAARIIEGVVANKEPHKTAELRWCTLDCLPQPPTITAQRAIEVYRMLSTVRMDS